MKVDNHKFPTYSFNEIDAAKSLASVVLLDKSNNYQFDHVHAHNYHEIIVFIKGGGNHEINFQTHTIQDYSIHILAANNLHKVERHKDSTGFAINYSDKLLALLSSIHKEINFYSLLQYSQLINLNDIQQSEFHFLLNELMSIQVQDAYALQLIGAFFTKLNHHLPNNNLPLATAHPFVINVINLINKHYTTLKTSQEYADLLHISPKTLQSKIKKLTGVTFYTLLQDRLIKEAKILLMQKSATINEISDYLGFKEVGHFSNWFKKLTQTSPSEYANRY